MTRVALAVVVFLAPALAQAPGVPPAVVSAEATWAGADALLPLLDSPDEAVRAAAIRALGRLEDPHLVPQLAAQLDSSSGAVRVAAAGAIARSVKGLDPASNPTSIADASARLARAANHAEIETGVAAAVASGRIAYGTADQVKAAEDALVNALDRTATNRAHQELHGAAARALESLARLNVKIAPLGRPAIERLAAVVRRTSLNDGADARRNALAALIASRGLDAETERIASRDADEQVRRVAMTVLAGTSAILGPAQAADLIAAGLADESALVRYDALRAYVRHVAVNRGCGPIVDRLRDTSSHVALLAIDALGDSCKEDAAMTTRLAGEVRPPAAGANWHRPAHAFVSLAKRSKDRAVASMPAFSTSPVWQVRMYAGRAAAAVQDVQTLARLAGDANDNVRESVLEPLHQLAPTDAQRAALADMHSGDYQLLRSAALILKGTSSNHDLVSPMIGALDRVTNERKETSRDTRVALVEAIAQHGGAGDSNALRPFLSDFDPMVASAAAAAIGRWTGSRPETTPRPIARGDERTAVAPAQCATVTLRSGESFRMTLLTGEAPLTAGHFVALAGDRYYDGLTFHRVVPAFVIQGGSPGANEYAGQKAFMRDEVGAPNVRGSVGLSTRGRNTGDAQFYVNLVDNPRLDGDYTVFAQVPPGDLAVVDAIEEGDAITTIRAARCSSSTRRPVRAR